MDNCEEIVEGGAEMTDIYAKNEFEIEIVARGEFVDTAAWDERYRGEAAVIRLSHVALCEWQKCSTFPHFRDDFDTQEEYDKWKEEWDAARELFDARIRSALGWKKEDASFSLTRNLSEIFTAVRIWKLAEGEGFRGMPLETLELSCRTYNCLRRAGMLTVGDLMEAKAEDLLKVRNLGRKSCMEIVDRLHANGIRCDITENRKMFCGGAVQA